MPVIGFTNGCFDLLHRGHRYFLAIARSECDHLVIAINTDESVRRLKGLDRPLVPFLQRAIEIARYLPDTSIREFDTDDDLIALIRNAKPDIIFKGDDYSREEIIGHAIAKEARIIARLPGISTTEIAKRRA